QNQAVIDFAHLPNQLLVERRHRHRQQGDQFFDGFTRRQQQGHVGNIFDRESIAQNLLGLLAARFAGQRLGDGLRGELPEFGGADQSVIGFVRQHQSLALRAVSGGLRRQQNGGQPIPGGHQGAAGDTALLFHLARRASEQVLKGTAEQAQRRGGAFVIFAPQDGAQTFQNVIM